MGGLVGSLRLHRLRVSRTVGLVGLRAQPAIFILFILFKGPPGTPVLGLWVISVRACLALRLVSRCVWGGVPRGSGPGWRVCVHGPNVLCEPAVRFCTTLLLSCTLSDRGEASKKIQGNFVVLDISCSVRVIIGQVGCGGLPRVMGT